MAGRRRRSRTASGGRAVVAAATRGWLTACAAGGPSRCQGHAWSTTSPRGGRTATLVSMARGTNLANVAAQGTFGAGRDYSPGVSMAHLVRNYSETALRAPPE